MMPRRIQALGSHRWEPCSVRSRLVVLPVILGVLVAGVLLGLTVAATPAPTRSPDPSFHVMDSSGGMDLIVADGLNCASIDDCNPSGATSGYCTIGPSESAVSCPSFPPGTSITAVWAIGETPGCGDDCSSSAESWVTWGDGAVSPSSNPAGGAESHTYQSDGSYSITASTGWSGVAPSSLTITIGTSLIVYALGGTSVLVGIGALAVSLGSSSGSAAAASATAPARAAPTTFATSPSTSWTTPSYPPVESLPTPPSAPPAPSAAPPLIGPPPPGPQPVTGQGDSFGTPDSPSVGSYIINFESINGVPINPNYGDRAILKYNPEVGRMMWYDPHTGQWFATPPPIV
jgi:hypothetical protein